MCMHCFWFLLPVFCAGASAAFNYDLTHKAGFHHDFSKAVHNGMMTPKGLDFELKTVFSERGDRYMRLKVFFAAAIRRLQELYPDHQRWAACGQHAFVALKEFLKMHELPDPKALREHWHEQTNPMRRIDEGCMDLTPYTVAQLDGTSKITKHFRFSDCDGRDSGRPEQLKLQLNVVNELGMYLDSRLMRSEKPEFAQDILLRLKEKQIARGLHISEFAFACDDVNKFLSQIQVGGPRLFSTCLKHFQCYVF